LLNHYVYVYVIPLTLSHIFTNVDNLLFSVLTSCLVLFFICK